MTFIHKTSLLILFTFYSCNAFAFKATFINPGKQGERFWDMVTETMRAAADDFDIELEVLYAQRNRIEMAKLGIDVAQRTTPPEYLILVNEEQAAEKILLATRGTETRVLMLLNDFLPEQYKRIDSDNSNPNLIGAIVPDNFSAGQRMMQALLQCAEQRQSSDTFHVLAIGGDQLTPASIDRNNGALDIINKNPQIRLDRFLYANWNQQEAEQLTTNYLLWANRNNIKPAAIWAANDPIAMGAKNALHQQGLSSQEDICLVGLNWSTQGLTLVKQGEMLLTDGGHFLAGAWSMVALNDHHRHRQTKPETPLGKINFQMQSIDQQNIDRYLTKLGDENWERIDFKGFSKDAGIASKYDFSLNRVFKLITE